MGWMAFLISGGDLIRILGKGFLGGMRCCFPTGILI